MYVPKYCQFLERYLIYLYMVYTLALELCASSYILITFYALMRKIQLQANQAAKAASELKLFFSFLNKIAPIWKFWIGKCHTRRTEKGSKSRKVQWALFMPTFTGQFFRWCRLSSLWRFGDAFYRKMSLIEVVAQGCSFPTKCIKFLYLP